MVILKGNESFDVILMDSLSNLSAGDQAQRKFLVHRGWNLPDFTRSGVGFKPLDYRGVQTERSSLGVEEFRERRIFDSLCREYKHQIIES